MLDQLHQVAIFAKTIDHGSFRGAAQELGLSPSVISYHVSQLEKHLGVALFYRIARKLALTKYLLKNGSNYLLQRTPLSETEEDALSELSDPSSNPSGELRVATRPILLHSQLIDAWVSQSIDGCLCVSLP